MQEPDLSFSPILSILERLFRTAGRVSLERLFVKPRTQVTYPGSATKEQVVTRAKLVDIYIVGWIFMEIALAGATFLKVPGPLAIGMVLIAAFRVLDIFQTAVNLTIFEPLRLGSQRQNVASLHRTLVLSILNYSELVVLFGIIYATKHDLLCGASGVGDAYYFSAITQLTVGYGDLQPTGVLKAVSTVHAYLGVVFAILVVGRFISTLPGLTSGLYEQGPELSQKPDK